MLYQDILLCFKWEYYTDNNSVKIKKAVWNFTVVCFGPSNVKLIFNSYKKILNAGVF